MELGPDWLRKDVEKCASQVTGGKPEADRLLQLARNARDAAGQLLFNAREYEAKAKEIRRLARQK